MRRDQPSTQMERAARHDSGGEIVRHHPDPTRQALQRVTPRSGFQDARTAGTGGTRHRERHRQMRDEEHQRCSGRSARRPRLAWRRDRASSPPRRSPTPRSPCPPRATRGVIASGGTGRNHPITATTKLATRRRHDRRGADRPQRGDDASEAHRVPAPASMERGLPVRRARHRLAGGPQASRRRRVPGSRPPRTRPRRSGSEPVRMRSIGNATGRSRLLYWNTRGISAACALGDAEREQVLLEVHQRFTVGVLARRVRVGDEHERVHAPGGSRGAIAGSRPGPGTV